MKATVWLYSIVREGSTFVNAFSPRIHIYMVEKML
jgi:hypothetical protein